MNIHEHSGILIVDDSSAVRGIVRKLLGQLGYKTIDEASDGAVAFTKISEGHFDLVISDWNMQPMNGQELLERIRGEKAFAKLRFIMMTAESAIDKIVQAKQSGCSCFINKPFSAEGLQAKIAQVNAGHRAAAVA